MTRSLYKKVRMRKHIDYQQIIRMRQLQHQAESYHPCSDNEHKCSHVGQIQTCHEMCSHDDLSDQFETESDKSFLSSTMSEYSDDIEPLQVVANDCKSEDTATSSLQIKKEDSVPCVD